MRPKYDVPSFFSLSWETAFPVFAAPIVPREARESPSLFEKWPQDCLSRGALPRDSEQCFSLSPPVSPSSLSAGAKSSFTSPFPSSPFSIFEGFFLFSGAGGGSENGFIERGGEKQEGWGCLFPLLSDTLQPFPSKPRKSFLTSWNQNPRAQRPSRRRAPTTFSEQESGRDGLFPPYSFVILTTAFVVGLA